MSYTQCDASVVKMLLKLFKAGLRSSPRADLEELLEAVRVLRPGAPEPDICETQLRILMKDWIGAVHLLRDVDWRGKGSPLCSALQGWCLYELGDREWRRHVSTVLWDASDLASIALIGQFMNLPALRSLSTVDIDDLRATIVRALQDATVN